MDNSESKELFTQVRVAHRLLAVYYQKIHRLMEEVVSHDELELEFLSWDPMLFDRPALSRVNQLDRYAFDLLPGVDTEYLFLRGQRKLQEPGDWLLVFHLTSSPEDGKSVLRCYIVAPRKPLEFDWYHDIWLRICIGYPEITETPEAECMCDESGLYACAFEVSIEQLTDKDAVPMLVKKIKECRDVAVGSATTE
ncbi:MAG: hypothetical protein CR963_00410 [Gammaproteobacteria bacterium]|nr:MAG: hypothetical protein CR963_00410 [Gammaproteobacteria bacterium]